MVSYVTSVFVGDLDGDFDAAAQAERVAAETAERELGPGVFSVKGATFLEFDSANPSHAAAYFEVRIDGPTQREVDAVARG